MVKFCASITGSKDIAEELYSDLMIRIWQKEEELSMIENLKLYLYKSIKNSAFSYLKKEKGRQFVNLETVDELGISEASIEDNYLQAEFRQQLQTAVDSLPPKCKMVYILIKENGLNHKQVSEILNISTNTIEGHMTNALKKIVVQLKKYLFSED